MAKSNAKGLSIMCHSISEKFFSKLFICHEMYVKQDVWQTKQLQHLTYYYVVHALGTT